MSTSDTNATKKFGGGDLKGIFVHEDIHRAAKVRAASLGMTLRDFVVQAIKSKLAKGQED